MTSTHPHPLSGSADVVDTLAAETGSDVHHDARTLIDHVLEALAAAALATITLLLFTNAVLRFTINSPIGGTEEIVTGLMLWLTMLGFVVGVRRNESISVRAFADRLPFRTQVWLKLATDLITAAVLLHLAWFAFQYVTEFGGDSTPYLQLPRAFFTAALPVGALAAALIVLVQLPSGRRVLTRWKQEEGR